MKLPERQGLAVRVAENARPACVPDAAQGSLERGGERDLAFLAALGGGQYPNDSWILTDNNNNTLLRV